MEKFSAYLDAGTGIQPFLHPVPPQITSVFARIITPLGILCGISRTFLILLVGVLYFLLVDIFLKAFYPLGPLFDFLSWILTALLSRLVLCLLGFWWIPVSYITRKRGRGSIKTPWQPRGGDIIVSNWASWIEVLWLAYRFNPIFLLPVVSKLSEQQIQTETIITPGRRTGTGSAAISSRRPPSARIAINGYEPVSLLRMLYLTGNAPPYSGTGSNVQTLDVLRAKATRPLVVFPECTTSNGRALLKFSEAFGVSSVPVGKFKLFLMCVRYDAPTIYKPSLTHSIPSKLVNPIKHIFAICSSLSPFIYQSLSIRLLNPNESPSNGSFIASEVLSGSGFQDEISEACSVLVSQLGKMRSTSLGWEDKVSFLNFYRSKVRKNKTLT